MLLTAALLRQRVCASTCLQVCVCVCPLSTGGPVRDGGGGSSCLWSSGEQPVGGEGGFQGRSTRPPDSQSGLWMLRYVSAALLLHRGSSWTRVKMCVCVTEAAFVLASPDAAAAPPPRRVQSCSSDQQPAAAAGGRHQREAGDHQLPGEFAWGFPGPSRGFQDLPEPSRTAITCCCCCSPQLMEQELKQTGLKKVPLEFKAAVHLLQGGAAAGGGGGVLGQHFCC